jgi:hypothetical protein
MEKSLNTIGIQSLPKKIFESLQKSLHFKETDEAAERKIYRSAFYPILMNPFYQSVFEFALFGDEGYGSMQVDDTMMKRMANKLEQKEENKG